MRIGNEVVEPKLAMKYLGVYLDQKWSFKDHIDYIEDKASKMIRSLSKLMPNLRGPGGKKRRLYANTINSVNMYGAPIWSKAINGSPKLQRQLRRIQRTLAIRVVAGYRTVSADAALFLARTPPTSIQAAYFSRVYARVCDLKDSGDWSRRAENEIKDDEQNLLERQWQIYLQRPDIAGRRTCEAIAPILARCGAQETR